MAAAPTARPAVLRCGEWHDVHVTTPGSHREKALSSMGWMNGCESAAEIEDGWTAGES